MINVLFSIFSTYVSFNSDMAGTAYPYKHMRSSPVFIWIRVTRFLVFYVLFADRYLSFSPFSLAIVLSVLRFTASDYPFGIFSLHIDVYVAIW